MNVLVIEDNKTQSSLISKMIGKVNRSIVSVVAHDVFDGYFFLKAHANFDLILLDVEMPFAKGTTLLEKIRKKSNFLDIPIVMSTSHEETQAYLDMGATEVYQKPFGVESLEKLIAKYQRQSDPARLDLSST
ncbi:MAG: response regulator [bacterium]|nr:response regulator [bacterium]